MFWLPVRKIPWFDHPLYVHILRNTNCKVNTSKIEIKIGRNSKQNTYILLFIYTILNQYYFWPQWKWKFISSISNWNVISDTWECNELSSTLFFLCLSIGKLVYSLVKKNNKDLSNKIEMILISLKNKFVLHLNTFSLYCCSNHKRYIYLFIFNK